MAAMMLVLITINVGCTSLTLQAFHTANFVSGVYTFFFLHALQKLLQKCENWSVHRLTILLMV